MAVPFTGSKRRKRDGCFESELGVVNRSVRNALSRHGGDGIFGGLRDCLEQLLKTWDDDFLRETSGTIEGVAATQWRLVAVGHERR